MAVVGKGFTVMVIKSVDGGQDAPFVIDHLNVLTPGVNPVTPELNAVGVVTVAPPETTVQRPVPTSGLFPASVAVPGEIQRV